MDTRCCKFCGVEFNKVRYDEGTFDEGYCSKFHRSDHEKQMIMEGTMESIRQFSDKGDVKGGVIMDGKYRDANGEMIWFPKDGRPYYDIGLGRQFHSKKEKCDFMKEKGIIMDGSNDKTNINRCPEAGDARFRKVR